MAKKKYQRNEFGLSRNELLIVELDRIAKDLPDDSQGFANSLLSQYRKRGELTGKQWYYVKDLLRRR